jgi:hypothetical protein
MSTRIQSHSQVPGDGTDVGSFAASNPEIDLRKLHLLDLKG